MLIAPGYFAGVSAAHVDPSNQNPFTWNSADSHAEMTLSGGDLIVTRSAVNSGNWRSARATAPLVDGQYWEVLINSTANSNVMLGLGNVSATLSSFCGSDANGWAYNAGSGGRKFNNGSPAAYVPGMISTNILGLCYSAANGGEIYVLKNNVPFGTSDPVTEVNPMFSGVGTSGVYAMASLFENPDQLTLSTLIASLTYAAPGRFKGA